MKPHPYLYFSVVELIDNSGPIFLNEDDTHEGEFSSLYKTEYVILGATALKAIWYDFEKKSFLKLAVELDPLQLYGGISLMVMTGGAAIAWLAHTNGCEAVEQMQCQSVEVEDVNPEWEMVRIKFQKTYDRKRDYYSQGAAQMLKVVQLQTKRYNYRYAFMVCGEEEMDLTLLQELLVDGSMRQLTEGSILNYRDRARPSKIELGWTVGNDNYSAFFFIDDAQQLGIFNRVYGVHLDTKSDYIFNIDIDAEEYSLALYRQGLKDPVAIPESAYQLIVFKNKFECYRSENYNQSRGAWIW